METLADGTRIQRTPDGTTLRILKDGTKIQTNKQGIRVEVARRVTRADELNGMRLETIPQKNGKLLTVQTNPDGTKITVRPDGSRKQENPDGTIIEVRADRSRRQIFPNGDVIDIDASGKVVSRGKRPPTTKAAEVKKAPVATKAPPSPPRKVSKPKPPPTPTVGAPASSALMSKINAGNKVQEKVVPPPPAPPANHNCGREKPAPPVVPVAPSNAAKRDAEVRVLKDENDTAYSA